MPSKILAAVAESFCMLKKSMFLGSYLGIFLAIVILLSSIGVCVF